ncbi:hypothetical protein HOY80DRAFT_1068971 [Tuber brumale]|nr:hypothetical protein HOY80DRAFT_1068971 [Tuber brumale]
MGGIDEDMHVDKPFASQREPPPKIEWWGPSLTTTSSCEEIPPEFPQISAADTIVTHYVQNLVLLAPSQDQLAPPIKPFPLTKDQQEKVQRLADALKEESASTWNPHHRQRSRNQT